MSKSRRSRTTDASARERLRRLPSVERILALPDLRTLSGVFGRGATTDAARAVVSELRALIGDGLDGEGLEEALGSIASRIERHLSAELRGSLRPVVNATGIIVHTNLGRAPLSSRALRALTAVARGYSNLELDLRSGKRGSRHQHASELLSRMFPKTSALVVNNAAAAVMLSLNTFARGKEVVISRGELVEIGGSFRVPDILERSGARLREVGTTNKTRVSDYEEAIGPSTGALLRVHPSNFRIVGFTESAPTPELVELGKRHGLPVIEDFGSGNVVPLGDYGLPNEPTVQESLASGVSLTIFSGDKLLGGPQAGVLLGDPERVRACRENPMARALRVDKLTYAALEATLLSFVEEKATREVPVLRMLSTPKEEVEARCKRFVAASGELRRLRLSIESTTARVGGGAAADAEIPSAAVALDHVEASAEKLARELRTHDPPVLARIADDRVLLDLRTVAEEEEPELRAALERLDAI